MVQIVGPVNTSYNYFTEGELEDLCKSCGLVNYSSNVQRSFIMFSGQKPYWRILSNPNSVVSSGFLAKTRLEVFAYICAILCIGSLISVLFLNVFSTKKKCMLQTLRKALRFCESTNLKA
jgi:hypothetical protein